MDFGHRYGLMPFRPYYYPEGANGLRTTPQIEPQMATRSPQIATPQVVCTSSSMGGAAIAANHSSTAVDVSIINISPTKNVSWWALFGIRC